MHGMCGTYIQRRYWGCHMAAVVSWRLLWPRPDGSLSDRVELIMLSSPRITRASNVTCTELLEYRWRGNNMNGGERAATRDETGS